MTTKREITLIHARECLACGKTADLIMENAIDTNERGAFCVSCAELLASEMVLNEHGDHIQPWRAA